jgi:hypothetical protein
VWHSIVKAQYADDGKRKMNCMWGRFDTTWLVRFAVLAFILATLIVVSANAVTARHCHAASSAPICEQIACDDLDEVCLENITPPTVALPERPVPFSHAVITVLRLSPVIFQPPEAA